MLTPSQKLDELINRGFTPRIGDVVDLGRYKYVWTGARSIRIGNIVVDMPYGLLSDGASGVPDRLPFAFWVHDRLYLSPYATISGVRTRLTRRQCDLIYAKIGLQHRVFIVALEGIALALGLGRRAWKRYRKQDESKLIESHIVPRSMCWDFPTQYVAEAVWVGHLAQCA